MVTAFHWLGFCTLHSDNSVECENYCQCLDTLYCPTDRQGSDKPNLFHCDAHLT